MEDIVRGNVDQRSLPLRRDPRQIARCRTVQKHGHGRLILSLVHIGVSRAVHDHIHPLGVADNPDRLDVGDVQAKRLHPWQRDDVREYVVVPAPCRNIAEFRPQLPVGSRHKNIHDNNLFLQPLLFVK